MAEDTVEVQMYEVVPAPRRILVAMQIYDVRSGHKLFSTGPHISSDIDKVKRFLGQHGMTLQQTDLLRGPQYSPPTLIHGNDVWTPTLIKQPRPIAVPAPVSLENQEPSGSSTGSTVPPPLFEGKIYESESDIPETETGQNGSKIPSEASEGIANFSPKGQIPMDPTEPKPTTSSMAGPTKSKSSTGIPAQSNKSGETINKRQKKTPVDIPATPTSSRPKREAKMPARYSDEDFPQNKRQKVKVPNEPEGGSMWSQKQPSLKDKAKTHEPSDSSYRLPTVRPKAKSENSSSGPCSSSYEDLELKDLRVNVLTKIPLDEFRKTPIIGDDKQMDKDINSTPLDIKDFNSTSVPTDFTSKNDNIPTTTTYNNDETQSAIQIQPQPKPSPNISTIPTPTKFGEFRQNQFVFARRIHYNKHYTAGRILSKCGTRKCWLVEFNEYPGDQKVIRPEDMIPVDFLGKGIHVRHVEKDRENRIVWKPNIIILGHFKADATFSLKYNFRYNEKYNQESNVGDWMNFEIHDSELMKLREQWNEYQQERGAAQNSTPLPAWLGKTPIIGDDGEVRIN